MTQQIYSLQTSIKDLKEEKEELTQKPFDSTEEMKLLTEIQTYNNITTTYKENCFELIKEIEKLKDDLSKYTINPSPPLLNYLSEMITEPYEKWY